MITDYETILISAVRYALGRRTYVVEITTDYVARQLSKLSDSCIKIITDDIKNPPVYLGGSLHGIHLPTYGGYGDPCDEREWMCLLEQLEEEMGKRYGQS